LYSEPKKLVDLGYATTHTEENGKRTRNVYEITDEGRDALGEWTSSTTQPPRIEIEALLRLLFADHGTLEDVLRALDELEADIGEHHDAIVELMGSKSIERWIDFARAEIDQWPTTKDLGMTQRTETLTLLLSNDESPLGDQNPTPELPDPNLGGA
jgi:DNA-binding PadR family transcriptional regulator